VIVTVEARTISLPIHYVHCTLCGDVARYPGETQAQQWAQHHRMSVHAESYGTGGTTRGSLRTQREGV
jgi:hypothetical protein